jgi:hypothetical protein
MPLFISDSRATSKGLPLSKFNSETEACQTGRPESKVSHLFTVRIVERDRPLTHALSQNRGFIVSLAREHGLRKATDCLWFIAMPPFSGFPS